MARIHLSSRFQLEVTIYTFIIVLGGPNCLTTLAKNVDDFIRENELEDSYLSNFKLMEKSEFIYFGYTVEEDDWIYTFFFSHHRDVNFDHFSKSSQRNSSRQRHIFHGIHRYTRHLFDSVCFGYYWWISGEFWWI